MEKLKTLSDLKIGLRVTEIHNDGSYTSWLLLARNPLLDPYDSSGNYWKSAYFVNTLGMREVEKWSDSDLSSKELYINFTPKEAIDKAIERAKEYLIKLRDMRDSNNIIL